MFLISNKDVREDMIRTFNRIANIGGFGNLAAATADAIMHQEYTGFVFAVVFILFWKVLAWVLMDYKG